MKNFIILLMVLAIVGSCKKDDDEPTKETTCTIESLDSTEKFGDDDVTKTKGDFQYTDDGVFKNLDIEINIDDGWYREVSSFTPTYDGDNLSELNIVSNVTKNDEPRPESKEKYTYTYSEGKLIRYDLFHFQNTPKKVSDSSFIEKKSINKVESIYGYEPIFHYVLEYNGDKLSKITMEHTSLAKSVLSPGELNIEWIGNNITKTYMDINSSYTTYEYDDKVNIFKGVALHRRFSLYMGDEGDTYLMSYFSENNLVKITNHYGGSNSELSFELKYDDNGYIDSFTASRSIDPNYSYTSKVGVSCVTK